VQRLRIAVVAVHAVALADPLEARVDELARRQPPLAQHGNRLDDAEVRGVRHETILARRDRGRPLELSAVPTPAIDRQLALDGERVGGRFRRQPSRFREWVSADGSTGFPAAPGRYHLYVSYACPWAHRTVIGRRLKGLEEVVGMSVVDPVRDERGWAFTGGEYVDRQNGWSFLSEAYHATDPGFDGRFSVPVLWDSEPGRMVNNDSGHILRTLETGLGALGSPDVDLCPEPPRPELDELDARMYDS